MARLRPPSALVLIGALLALSGVLAGCDNEAQFEAQIKPDLQMPGGRAVEVTKIKVAKAEVEGVTTKEGQSIDIDCIVTVKGIAGDKPFEKTFKVGLHTKKLPKGTRFHIKCDDPLITQLPADATAFAAAAAPASGPEVSLPVKSGLKSVTIGGGRRLKAQAGTRLAVIGFPTSLKPGVYTARFTFALKSALAIKQKFMVAAEATCRGRTIYVPLLPARKAFSSIPAVTIPASATPQPIAAPNVTQAKKLSLTIPCG
jgi:hypothetical protein